MTDNIHCGHPPNLFNLFSLGLFVGIITSITRLYEECWSTENEKNLKDFIEIEDPWGQFVVIDD